MYQLIHFYFAYKITGITKHKSKSSRLKFMKSPSSSPRTHPHHKSQNNSPQQKESETSLKAADKTYHHDSKAPTAYLSLHPP